MDSLVKSEKLTQKQQLKIKDVIKGHLEGEVIDLAIAMKNSSSEGTSFSRSTGSYHSRSGHSFSRADVRIEDILPNSIQKSEKEVDKVVNDYFDYLEALK